MSRLIPAGQPYEQLKLPLFAVCALAAALALLNASCSDEKTGGCTAVCLPVATFTFKRPPSGTAFEIKLGDSVSTCQVENGASAATCQASANLHHVEFVGQELRSLVWKEPPAGTLAIEVTVDGSLAVEQQFSYSPKAAEGSCVPCYADPHFEVD